MLARTDTVATIAQSWLAQFEAAVAAPDRPRLKTLFHTDSHLRDMLALTWHIKPVNGSDAILRELPTHAGHARSIGFQIDLHRSAPRKVTRAGTDAIESIFNFETVEGRGSGVLRLTPDADDGNEFEAQLFRSSGDASRASQQAISCRSARGKDPLDQRPRHWRTRSLMQPADAFVSFP